MNSLKKLDELIVNIDDIIKSNPKSIQRKVNRRSRRTMTIKEDNGEEDEDLNSVVFSKDNNIDKKHISKEPDNNIDRKHISKEPDDDSMAINKNDLFSSKMVIYKQNEKTNTLNESSIRSIVRSSCKSLINSNNSCKSLIDSNNNCKSIVNINSFINNNHNSKEEIHNLNQSKIPLFNKKLIDLRLVPKIAEKLIQINNKADRLASSKKLSNRIKKYNSNRRLHQSKRNKQLHHFQPCHINIIKEKLIDCEFKTKNIAFSEPNEASVSFVSSDEILTCKEDHLIEDVIKILSHGDLEMDLRLVEILDMIITKLEKSKDSFTCKVAVNIAICKKYVEDFIELKKVVKNFTNIKL